MRYFLSDYFVDEKQERENRQYDATLKNGTNQYEHGCHQYQVSGCCGRPVSPSCISGCVCPQCGRTFRR